MILATDGLKIQTNSFLGVYFNDFMSFQEIHNPAQEFFGFLPIDWQNELLPQWSRLSKSSKVFGLYEGNGPGTLVTIGIVFHTQLPKLTPYEKTLKTQLKGYSYIGYVYTMPEFRGKGCASNWFLGLQAHYPKYNFWLTIEEPALANFYKKNNFKLFTEPSSADTGEEICLILRQNPLDPIH